MPNRKEHIIENNIRKKHCPTCDQWKDLSSYNNQKSSWDGLARMCRDCITEYKRNKRKNDPKYREKDIAFNEKYKASGRRREKDQIRYADKKDEIIKKQVAYNKKRYHEDIEFRITHSLRTRINKVVKLKNAKKCNTTIALTGCTPNFLKGYLEAKFTDGMSWDNYGDWHVDHIRPCASFDLTNEDEQRICFHYKNLQPLWGPDNLEKGSKDPIIWEQSKKTQSIDI